MNKPKSVVGLHSMPWFHGKISREDAEKILVPRVSGLYLVRESVHYPGDYTLSLCSETGVEHYHIITDQNNKKLTVDEEAYFSSLVELVSHYQQDADGLVTNLKKPLEKSGNNAFYINQNDFVQSGWQIPKEELDIQELIGKGEFSEVSRALWKSENVAVKKVKDPSLVKLFLTEASVMTSLVHKNLVKLLGVGFDVDGSIFIVTEFMSKGSLVDYLRTRGRTVITKHDQIRFARDTCDGMAYLENNKLVHRDLAARNVLVHECGTAKVSDFGLALPFDSTQRTTGKIPIKWTAPEALKQNIFTSKSDVWSFGILLWEIYSFGRVPYPKIPIAEVQARIENNYRMDPPEGCPPEIHKIMEKTWQWDPAKRPSFKEISLQLVEMCSTTV